MKMEVKTSQKLYSRAMSLSLTLGLSLTMLLGDDFYPVPSMLPGSVPGLYFDPCYLFLLSLSLSLCVRV